MGNLLTIFFATLSIGLLSYILITKQPKKLKKIKIKNGDYQVVLVVNKDLGMSKGKVISQVGHAVDSLNEILLDYPELVDVWRSCGSAKIALKATQDQINKIYYDCCALGLPYARVFDAGKTQVKAGSNTIIAVGPATKQELEDVTGHLPLY